MAQSTKERSCPYGALPRPPQAPRPPRPPQTSSASSSNPCKSLKILKRWLDQLDQDVIQMPKRMIRRPGGRRLQATKNTWSRRTEKNRKTYEQMARELAAAFRGVNMYKHECSKDGLILLHEFFHRYNPGVEVEDKRLNLNHNHLWSFQHEEWQDWYQGKTYFKATLKATALNDMIFEGEWVEGANDWDGWYVKLRSQRSRSSGQTVTYNNLRRISHRPRKSWRKRCTSAEKRKQVYSRQVLTLMEFWRKKWTGSISTSEIWGSEARFGTTMREIHQWIGCMRR